MTYLILLFVGVVLLGLGLAWPALWLFYVFAGIGMAMVFLGKGRREARNRHGETTT